MRIQADRQKESTSELGQASEIVPPEFRFDNLVGDLARTFVRVTVDEIDDELNQWLKRIVLALDLDRSTLAQFDPKSGLASFTHGWAREKDQTIGPPLDANALFPWLRMKMLAGETIVFSSPDELPPEAARDIQNLGHYMPQSNVTIPIRFAGVVVGAVGFGALHRKRQWSQALVRQLETVVEILGYALERKRTAIEMRRLRKELEYLSRINTMGVLAAALAHELNQPLAAILSNAEAIQSMLRNDRPDADESTAAIADIIQDTVRASENIRRLGSMFRRQEIKTTLLDPSEVIAEVGRLVRGEGLIRNVSFRLEAGQAMPKVAADRVQLQQAVLNLVLNAFDAVSAAEGGPREVFLSVLSADDGSVVISVRDSGQGIDAAVRQRIFEPFFTTKPDGTGIGLSITRSIIENHGGRLSVGSNPGRGVTFQITLPAASESSSPGAQHASQTREAGKGGEQMIAIVDDDSAIRRSLGRVITSAGYSVSAFASAREFLSSPESRRARCLVLDLLMPEVDGLKLQRTLRDEIPHLSVVFLTGRGDVSSSVDAMKAGAVDFLQKPVKAEVLLEAIKRSVRRSDELRVAQTTLEDLKDRHQRLTAREREVFALVSAGLLNKQVAAELGASEKTIKQHRGRVMSKMQSESLADLVVMAETLHLRPRREDLPNNSKARDRAMR